MAALGAQLDGYSAVPVTVQVLMQELLGQAGHYSERVRKDALAGLASLLKSHPEELRRQVSA